MNIDVVQVELVKKYKIDVNNEYVYGVETCKDIFIEQIGKCNVEVVGLLCLDSTDKIINYSNISIGNINNVEASLAQIFKVALLSNASKIIIAHNHPSNILEITKSDIKVTKKIAQIASVFQIKLIDSLVVNMDGDVISIRESMKEE